MRHYKSLEFLGFPNYRVADDGTVWRLYKWKGRQKINYWRKLKPRGGEDRYKQVTLCDEGRKKQYQVHTLVLLAFIGPCPDGMECRHFPDRDKGNNKLENLQWDTHSNNLNDRIFHGTVPVIKHVRGSKHWGAKLTEEMIPLIRSAASEGKGPAAIRNMVYQKWGIRTTSEAIAHVIKGRAWTHVI